MVDAGVDAVEVGLPYSDPVMDGPTIQAAAEVALAAGIRTTDVFSVVEASAALVPTLVMTYWNPVERFGVERFSRDLAAAGGAGLITPDLIPDEAGEWVAAADAHGLDKVFLVAPSSTQARLQRTADACRGFVYATAVMGVTGAREQTSRAAPDLVARVHEVTDAAGRGRSGGVRRPPSGGGGGLRRRRHRRQCPRPLRSGRRRPRRRDRRPWAGSPPTCPTGSVGNFELADVVDR